ncbi:hypothetical protein QYM36_007931 [Artemia franciscana]|uniref:Uncharacterized protein n=1 Tax=Artemia franciscana TaxID=6661 RepID=A0AA88IDG2_ARTSF|nr:hypothetical protein QYM36_007931 [Artemia franciscana]
MRLKYQDELQRESRNNEKALTYDGAKSTRVKLMNGRTVFDRRTRSLPNGSRNIRKEKLKGSGDPGTYNVKLATPTKAEILKVIKALKDKKPQAKMVSTPEIYKQCLEITMKQLHGIFEEVWRTNTFPKDYKTSVILPFYKKTDKIECNNYRGISLIDIADLSLNDLEYTDDVKILSGPVKAQIMLDDVVNWADHIGLKVSRQLRLSSQLGTDGSSYDDIKQRLQKA